MSELPHTDVGESHGAACGYMEFCEVDRKAVMLLKLWKKSHEVKIQCLCEIKTGLQLQWSRRWDLRVQLNVYKCKSFSHPVTSSPLCHGCMTMVWYLMMRSVSLCCSCLLSTRLAGWRSESWSISTRGACSAARWSRSSSTHITTTWCTDCSTHCGTAWVHNSNTHTSAMWSCNTQKMTTLFRVLLVQVSSSESSKYSKIMKKLEKRINKVKMYTPYSPTSTTAVTTTTTVFSNPS